MSENVIRETLWILLKLIANCKYMNPYFLCCCGLSHPPWLKSLHKKHCLKSSQVSLWHHCCIKQVFVLSRKPIYFILHSELRVVHLEKSHLPFMLMTWKSRRNIIRIQPLAFFINLGQQPTLPVHLTWPHRFVCACDNALRFPMWTITLASCMQLPLGVPPITQLPPATPPIPAAPSFPVQSYGLSGGSKRLETGEDLLAASTTLKLSVLHRQKV